MCMWGPGTCGGSGEATDTGPRKRSLSPAPHIGAQPSHTRHRRILFAPFQFTKFDKRSAADAASAYGCQGMGAAKLLEPFDAVFAEQKAVAAEAFNNDEFYKLKLNEVRVLKILAWACRSI